MSDSAQRTLLTNEVCWQAGVQEVGNTYSGVDLLINNAGICESVEEPVLEM